MPNTDEIRKKLASYKTMMKRQGDFTIYASNYIADIEALLPSATVEKLPAPSVAPSASAGQPGVRKRKKRTEEKSGKSD